MKEQIHTIPIHDALENAGECPFCYIERRTEEHCMNYVLGHGVSYMEADIREMTDKEGFCRAHYKKMFDYGNALGNAWILKTHYRRIIDEMNKEIKNFKPVQPVKKSFFSKSTMSTTNNSLISWIQKKEASCFICNNIQKTFDAYIKTFFEMYRKDMEIRNTFMETQGVCLSHFSILLKSVDCYLKPSEQEEFYQRFLPLMSSNMERIYEDLSWFIEKYDYKNKDADWKNSKDAVQRGMQKLKGADPSLPPYQLKR